MSKTICLIGGYGTYALMDVANKLVSTYSDLLTIDDDSGHPHIVIDNINTSTFTGEKDECLIERNNVEKSINHYSNIYNSKILLCVCCNSISEMFLHYPIKNENIQYINIISCVCNHIKKHVPMRNKLYLWCSEYTFNSNNYHRFLGSQYNIELNSNQRVITQLIKNIKANRLNKISCDDICKNIENDSVVILGCTELPLVKKMLDKYCLDNNRIITFIDCNLVYAEEIIYNYIL